MRPSWHGLRFTSGVVVNDDALAAMAVDSRAALGLLIVRGDRKIATIARGASGRFWFTEDRHDIHQQGRIGVCYAVRLYQPGSGRFWTYARHWIRHEVTRWIAYCGQPVHVPAEAFSLAASIPCEGLEDDAWSYDGRDAADELASVPTATRIAFAAMNWGDPMPRFEVAKPSARAPKKHDSTNQLDMWRNHGSDDCQK